MNNLNYKNNYYNGFLNPYLYSKKTSKPYLEPNFVKKNEHESSTTNIETSKAYSDVLLDISTNSNNNFSTTTDCIKIFGITLFFDDLIIISLLIFLYLEDVSDIYLFLILILLLLS